MAIGGLCSQACAWCQQHPKIVWMNSTAAIRLAINACIVRKSISRVSWPSSVFGSSHLAAMSADCWLFAVIAIRKKALALAAGHQRALIFHQTKWPLFGDRSWFGQMGCRRRQAVRVAVMKAVVPGRE